MPEGEVQGKMSYPLTAFVAAAAAGSGKLWTASHWRRIQKRLQSSLCKRFNHDCVLILSYWPMHDADVLMRPGFCCCSSARHHWRLLTYEFRGLSRTTALNREGTPICRHQHSDGDWSKILEKVETARVGCNKLTYYCWLVGSRTRAKLVTLNDFERRSGRYFSLFFTDLCTSGANYIDYNCSYGNWKWFFIL